MPAGSILACSPPPLQRRRARHQTSERAVHAPLWRDGLEKRRPTTVGSGPVLMYAVLRQRFDRTQGTGSDLGSQPHSVASMRHIAAVIALIACVHVGCWALIRGQSPAAKIEGPLASVSYAPYAASAHPNSGQIATAAQIR